MTAHLISTETGEKHTIDPNHPWMIGRDQNLAMRGLLLPDPSISRIHATIVCQQGNWMLQDESSCNGTMVNGSRLPPLQTILLQDGDRISFSGQDYVFTVDAEQMSCRDRRTETIALDRGITMENGVLRYFEDHPVQSFPVFQRKMLAEHRCARLLALTMMERESQIRIYYTIDGLHSLDRYLCRNHVAGGELLAILRQIAEGMKEAELYLIRSDQIPTELDRIFIEPKTKSVLLLVQPTKNESQDFTERYHQLIQSMLRNSTAHDANVFLERLDSLLADEQLGINALIRNIVTMEREFHQQSKGQGNWGQQTAPKVPGQESVLPESRLAIPWIDLLTWAKTGKKKLALIQTGCVLLLGLIYSLDVLRSSDFLGFSVLFFAADLWMMKSMNLI